MENNDQTMNYNPDVLYPPILIEKPEEQQTNISDVLEINDIRDASDFKGYSFSNYKKTEVKKKLIDSILSQKIEPACYWCAELICAGHFSEIWEIILYYTSKYIYIGNPKIAIYLDMRYCTFRNNMNQGTFISELDARNSDKIRKLFAEIICTLALSEKKPAFEQIKIRSHDNFDMTQLSNKLKAPNTEYIRNNMKPKDPRELIIAMNELSYSLSSECKNMASACYWIEWTLEFESICKKRKQLIKCEVRNYKVENKCRNNIVWIIWDILFDYASLQNNKLIERTMQSLINLFCIKFTDASPKKRRYLLYYAVSLITETVNTNVEILPNKVILQNVTNKIEMIYKQIKNNEVAPKTEYLFNGIDKKKSIEKSLKQMELVNSMISKEP
tara:strand:- start:5579 stop:6739 length:1161 start_codon:yes stop_codon:yes gene_type:complete